LTEEQFIETLGQIATWDNVSFKIVQSLPESGETNVIYLVPNRLSSGNDLFDEYV
jgi:hypothetical protein